MAEENNQIIPDGFYEGGVPDEIQALLDAKAAQSAEKPQPIVPTPSPVEQPQPTPQPTPQQAQPQVQDSEYETLTFKKGSEYEKFFNAFKSGDRSHLRDFVNIALTDYKGISDEGILEMEFNEENPELTQEEKKLLWNYTKAQKYSKGEDEATNKIVDLKMKMDAQRVRNAKEQLKSNYQFPVFEEPKTTQVDPIKVEAARRLQESLTNDPYLAEFEKSKSVKFGEGDEQFNFGINDTAKLKEVVFNNPNLIYEPFTERDKDGNVVKIDMAGISQLVAFAFNRNQILKDYSKFISDVAEQKFINGNLRRIGDNAPIPPAPAKPQDSIDI